MAREGNAAGERVAHAAGEQHEIDGGSGGLLPAGGLARVERDPGAEAVAGQRGAGGGVGLGLGGAAGAPGHGQALLDEMRHFMRQHDGQQRCGHRAEEDVAPTQGTGDAAGPPGEARRGGPAMQPDMVEASVEAGFEMVPHGRRQGGAAVADRARRRVTHAAEIIRCCGGAATGAWHAP